MNVLTVADCHGHLTKSDIAETLAGRKPDVIFFLGDNEAEDIELVKETVKDTAMYGVVGNHDYINILKDHGIEDLHGKTVLFDGFRIGGFGGTIKYKDDCSRLMFTNEESESLMAYFPKCDILITHDKPCFQKAKLFRKKEPVVVNAHSGMTGIAEYIKKNRPLYHLHGHLHVPYIEEKYGTKIRCCFRTEFLYLTKK